MSDIKSLPRSQIEELRKAVEQQQAAHWPEDAYEKMAKLCSLFPTLRDVPGTNPWHVATFLKWMNSGAPGSGAWNAGLFVLGVWNPATDWGKEGLKIKCSSAGGRFNMFRALGCWDREHEAAFREWLDFPFWP